MAETILTGNVPVGPANGAGSSYLEWGGIFGGGVIACAISVVFLQFGSSAGLALGSPAYSDEAGQRFRSITGHPFRFHSGRDSDLKPATFEHHLGRC
jgi:hypothetical protein